MESVLLPRSYEPTTTAFQTPRDLSRPALTLILVAFEYPEGFYLSRLEWPFRKANFATAAVKWLSTTSRDSLRRPLNTVP